MIPLWKDFFDERRLRYGKLMWFPMKIIEANFALKFLYVYISTIVCIKVQCEHVSFISGEENAEDILDAKEYFTGVN